jgi:hypothetical protein
MRVRWTIVVESSWVVMASQSLLAAATYYCSPRISARLRGPALRDAWARFKHGGKQGSADERSALLEADPAIQWDEDDGSDAPAIWGWGGQPTESGTQ